MLVQWCVKGVGQSDLFCDKNAADALLVDGLSSAWVRVNKDKKLLPALSDAHEILSLKALDAHVNNFGVARAATPYISLSAGQVSIVDPATGMTALTSPLDTVIEFATGKVWDTPHCGYVFWLWVLVTPKLVPELPGFGEEVRDLNQFPQYGYYHSEGEIAGKLLVPHRQIQRVGKYDADGKLYEGMDWQSLGLEQPERLDQPDNHFGYNPKFVPPERVNNVRSLI